jgi:hypothetical protein
LLVPLDSGAKGALPISPEGKTKDSQTVQF